VRRAEPRAVLLSLNADELWRGGFCLYSMFFIVPFSDLLEYGLVACSGVVLCLVELLGMNYYLKY
jgi:hypothetical protein